MTGSAFKAMDVVVGCLSYEKGGGLEEGGLKIRPRRRVADFLQSDLDCAGVVQITFLRKLGFCLLVWTAQAWPRRVSLFFGGFVFFFGGDLDCAGVVQTHI